MKRQVEQARWIGVLVATAIALYVCWLMIRPFLGVVAWAVVLVIVFYPVHRRLAIRISRPSLRALTSCTLVVLVIVLPLIVLTTLVAGELSKVIPTLPSEISQLLNDPTSPVARISGWINARFGVDMVSLKAFLVDHLKQSSDRLVGTSLNLMGNIASGIVQAFFVLFTMYYLFKDGDTIVDKLPAALPLSSEQSDAIIVRTKQVVGASVYGVVTIALIQGILGGIMFWILGVPSPLLWAVLMAFVCMIPVAGSFLVWLPLSIYLIATGHWTKAIILIVWGALIISTVDNVLRPKLVGTQTKLHELFVFFSVLGGISVFGLLGIVLGPVVLAITLGLLSTFQLRTKAPVSDEHGSALV
jgi:predicted PurR-regulated permease PerM